MHVHVLLAVAAVGKPSVTAFEFTFERFFTCKRQKMQKKGGGEGEIIVKPGNFSEWRAGD